MAEFTTKGAKATTNDEPSLMGKPLLARTSLGPLPTSPTTSAAATPPPRETPVKLVFQTGLDAVTEAWPAEELEDQRRLIQFQFTRMSMTEYLIEFKPITKREFASTSPVISCIYWREKEIYVVTSVDIILMLEYMVRDNFPIEEKNRIRRNLQLLKPYTISKKYTQFQRFFSTIMDMEDPRPRNIEQDLKVFQWSSLFVAISKVISKYSFVEDGHFTPPLKAIGKKFMPFKRIKEMKQKKSRAAHPRFHAAAVFDHGVKSRLDDENSPFSKNIHYSDSSLRTSSEPLLHSDKDHDLRPHMDQHKYNVTAAYAHDQSMRLWAHNYYAGPHMYHYYAPNVVYFPQPVVPAVYLQQQLKLPSIGESMNRLDESTRLPPLHRVRRSP